MSDDEALTRVACYVHKRAARHAWKRSVRVEREVTHLSLLRCAAAAHAAVDAEAVLPVRRRTRQSGPPPRPRGTPGAGVQNLVRIRPDSVPLLLLALTASRPGHPAAASPRRSDKGTHCTETGILATAAAADAAAAAAVSAAAAGAVAGGDPAGGDAVPAPPRKVVVVRGAGLRAILAVRPTTALSSGGLACLRRAAADALPGIDTLLAAAGAFAEPTERYRRLLGLQALCAEAARVCASGGGSWSRYRKHLVTFPPAAAPTPPRHVAEALAADQRFLPSTGRVIESVLAAAQPLTRAQASRAAAEAERERVRQRREAERGLLLRLREQGRGSLQRRREATKREVAATRALLGAASDDVAKKAELEREKRREEVRRMRSGEALRAAAALMADREIEGRFRVAFSEDDARDDLTHQLRVAAAAAAARAERAKRQQELDARRAEFRKQAEEMRRHQERQRTRAFVVERWRAEAVRLYLDRAAADSSPQARLDRHTKVLLAKYTLREEKRMLATQAAKEVQDLRSALAATFLDNERDRARADVAAKRSRVHSEQLRAKVEAAREVSSADSP